MSYGEKLDNAWYRVRVAWSDEESQKGAFQILINAKACADENPGYSVFDPDGNAVYTSKPNGDSGLQAKALKNLSEAEVIKTVGPLFTADQKKSGILASVSAAQFILESGYGKTDLAQGANNCFGMKKSLSGNTWAGSTWDGKTIYTKKTQEDDGRGNLYYITADFRKYPCVEDSIADHSAYLLGAKNGNSLRYAGLKGEKSYRKAIQIIKDGGYATDTKYVSKICEIIERWNLTQFEVKETGETRQEEMASVKYADRQVIDITKENLQQVPHKRGSNKIQFIVIHYLGVPNADNPYLYGGGYGGHYNIKRDGSVYKAADPKTAVVLHCGGGLQGSGGHSFHGICTNYNSIGIECGVCYTDPSVKEPSSDSSQWYFTTETQESLVWLVVELMKEYGIPIDHVIRHYDVSGKICPNPYVKNNKLRTSWTWDEFIANVKEQASVTATDTGKKQETASADKVVLDEKHAKYINSDSTHFISNSGSDENGGARDGKAGDQTGKEWQMRSWYNRPWSCVLRYPDQKVALKIATLGIDAALNDKIGYDQTQRDTYWKQLKAAGYEPAKITAACEEDCSAGVCANIRAAGYIFGIPALQNHGGTYTGDMRAALSKAGFKVLTDAKYLSSPDYLLPGDILLNDVHHTATNVSVGSKARNEWNPGTASPVYYRVRKSDNSSDSQIGAFTILENAILCADQNPGYYVFLDGEAVYKTEAPEKAEQKETSGFPYLVRISIPDLNYRKGPSSSYPSWGYIEPGIYTIVDEKSGWGLLKAYADERNGWVYLKYAERI